MTTIVDSNLPVARPSWDHSRLESRIVHLGCGAFHRAHQALYTHHLLESTDSDWGICEVNLMPGNDRVLIENLKKQQLLYTVAEKGAESTELKIIGSMKEALHPEIDGCEGILNAMARPQTAIVSLTVTEKGYCADAASGQLDLNNPLIKHDLENPTAPKSAIGYIVEALRLRREKGLKAFTVMSCDNVRENGHVAKVAVLGLAQARDPQLAAWIEENVTFPCTMVDRIVPAATPETIQEIADQLGVYDPCAIACEPFRQWVIEDNFVNGRPDWDKVGAQFVADVVPFEMMKLRMLNGSHSFLAYLGYLGGYETIADTVTNPAYRKAAFALMMQEQAPTLSMPEGTDLNAYATLLIERFSNPSLRHRTWQIAMDGSQKIPQRLLDPVRLHLQNGGSWRHLALGVAGWMRYTQGVDEQGNAIDVVDPMLAEFQKINAQYQGADRVKALLGLSGIFADDLPQNADFVGAVTAAYQQLWDFAVCKDYVELLKQARMNEDVEVVHYAITAMVELSKEYDSKLQELERLHQISPEDPEVMEQYCEFMEEYLSQGLLEEQIERVQRQRYEQLLEKKLKHQEDLHTCVCMVKNLMKLGDFEKAHEILQIIEKKWHRHEAYWILKVQYCVEQKQGEELKRTLDKMKKEHIYLSSKGREELALWIDS